MNDTLRTTAPRAGFRAGLLSLVALGATAGPGSGQDDDLFPTISAAPREVASYFSVLSWDSPAIDTRIASMGVGDAFPLLRWGDESGARGRVAIEFGVLAQFDLDGPSFDFVNADFFVGIPVSVRRGTTSVRGRFYHWSSHLGDEFLLSSGIDRKETSVEALELVVARDVGRVRLIGGGTTRLRRFPKSMGQGILRLGAEVHGDDLGRLPGFGAVRPVVATHVRWTNDRGWTPGVSLEAGLEVNPGTDGRRAWRLLFEYFDGPSPYGQFFLENLRFVGIGLQLR